MDDLGAWPTKKLASPLFSVLLMLALESTGQSIPVHAHGSTDDTELSATFLFLVLRILKALTKYEEFMTLK